MMKLFSLKTKGIGFLTTLLTLSFLSMGANKIGDVEIRDLTVTGASVGVTAASAAPDWLTATNYGVNEIVVDPNSGITYRSNQAHLSTGTNLTDDAAKYDVIGSASNGVIVTDWQSFSPTLSANFAATEEIYIYRRVGSTAEIRFSFKTGGSIGFGEPILTLPAGMTPSEAGTNDREKVGTYNVYNPLVSSSIADGELEGTFYVGGTHPTTHLTFIYRTISRNDLGNWDHATNTIPINSGVSGTIIVRIAEWANSGVTVPIQDLTEQTKWVTESVVPITLVNHAGSLNTATGLFQGYKDTNGKYGLRGNLFLNTGGSDDANFQVHLDQAGGSIAFESFQQALSCNGNSAGSTPATMTRCLAQGSNDIGIICTNCGSGLNELAITFDITLASKPNWFDSNRENPAAVSAFVPEATATTTGVVKKNLYITKVSAASYTSGDNGTFIETLSNVPDGTYRVTIGASLLSKAGVDGVSIISFQLNGSQAFCAEGGATKSLEFGSGSRVNTEALDDVSIYGSASCIIQFSGGTNVTRLIINIQNASTLSSPYYVLEKLENVELVTTAWD